MFKRIDHIELVTADPDRAVQFYTDVLGFTVRRRDQVPSTRLGPLDLVYLDLGGTTVELMTYPESKPAVPQTDEHLGYRMMALEVIKRPTYARAEIRDPDGNAIELREWLS